MFGGLGLLSSSKVRIDGKISRKEAAMYPDFKRTIYDGMSKTVYVFKNCSYKPDLERQFTSL